MFFWRLRVTISLKMETVEMENRRRAMRASMTIIILLIALFCCILVYLPYRDHENKRSCVDNLRRIGVAMQMYRNDNDDAWPLSPSYIEAYGKGTLQGCPSAPSGDTQQAFRGYGYNAVLTFGVDGPRLQHEISFPALTVALCDEAIDVNTTQSADPFDGEDIQPVGVEKGWKRHGGGGNYLFCDGHVQWYLPGEVKSRRAAVGEARASSTDGFRPADGRQPTFSF